MALGSSNRGTAGVQIGKPVSLGGGIGTQWALRHSCAQTRHTHTLHGRYAPVPPQVGIGPLQVPKHVLCHQMVDMAVV